MYYGMKASQRRQCDAHDVHATLRCTTNLNTAADQVQYTLLYIQGQLLIKD